jgi:predicted GNAT superfamily acetyltransferase
LKPRAAAQRAVLEAGPDLELRTLATQAEYAACVALQLQTWGREYADAVPVSLLKVTQRAGGVCAGAFLPDGQLVGFVYGLTGLRGGQLMHWSHMLAVAAEFRNHGVGRRLKEFQREQVRSLGVERMYWTFDPLVARNAHLNLNRLGTHVDEYVPDMYGNTGSVLHAFGTDRFVVSWAMSAPLPPPALSGSRTAPTAAGEWVSGGANGSSPPAVRIEIPADIESLPVERAREWREQTRPSFLRLQQQGYEVTGFVRDPVAGCFYLLTRGEDGR